MIIYALQDENVSVLQLFWAGIIPGLLISGSLMGYNFWASHRRNFRSDGELPNLQVIITTTIRAVPALFLPVLIVGGIHGGVFTPTEASVMAVFYALFAGMFIYRTLKLAMLPEILARSAFLTAAVLLIVTMSSAFAWVLTILQIPQALSAWISSLGLSSLGFLFAVNILLLAFGIFIEPLPGILVLVPILAPVAATLGIDPVHFAIVVIINLTLGMITPPVGSLLFVTGLVAKVRMSELNRELWPMLALQLLVLALITIFPQISLTLPHMLGSR